MDSPATVAQNVIGLWREAATPDAARWASFSKAHPLLYQMVISEKTTELEIEGLLLVLEDELRASIRPLR